MPSRTAVSKWLDKQVGKSIDVDKRYGAQCVDFANYYTDWTKNPRIPCQYAKQMFNNANPKYYQRIKNTLTFVPKCGDIMIWDGWSGNPAGHVAVVQKGTVAWFRSCDQNWNRHSVEKVTHNYVKPRVIGVLRPRNVK